MTTFAVALAWCALQVTLVTAAALVIRRLTPATEANGRCQIAVAGIVAVLLLTGLVLSPWPRWTNWEASENNLRDVARNEFQPITMLPATTRGSPRGPEPQVSKPIPANLAAPARQANRNSVATSNPGGGHALPAAPPVSRVPTATSLRSTWWERLRSGIDWPSLCVAGFAFGVSIAVLRFLGTWLSICKLCRAASPLDDSRIHALVNELTPALAIRRVPAIKQSPRLSSAATVGWLRPVVLLPTSWPDWTDTELRVVLAHELAHITARDFIASSLTQLARVLHFYHPLVYRLSSQLRLDQEIRADALAACLTGGTATYLRTLGRLALQNHAGPSPGYLHTFIPSRNTLLRRLEMLKLSESKPAHARRIATLARLALLMGVVVVGMGLRGPETGATANAQPPENIPQPPQAGVASQTNSKNRAGGPEKPSGAEQHGLQFVPRDASFVLSVQVGNLLAKPVAKPFAQSPIGTAAFEAQLGVAVQEIEQFTLTLLPASTGNGEGSRIEVVGGSLVSLRFTSDAAAQRFARKLVPAPRSSTYGGQTYEHDELRKVFIVNPEPRLVIVLSSEPLLRRVIVAGREGPRRTGWFKNWIESVKSPTDAALYVSPMFVADVLTPHRNGQRPEGDNIPGIVTRIDLGDDLKLHSSLEIDQPASVNDLQATVTALRNLRAYWRDSLVHERDRASRDGSSEGAVRLRMADLYESLLDDLQLSVQGSRITGDARGSASQFVQLLTAIVPEYLSSLSVVHSRQQAEQIVQAVTKYVEKNGHFPAAAPLGPDGKTPHSWRVELLPYLGFEKLYAEYSLDEPWDSPQNRLVLARMPAVYRSERAAPESTNANFFFVTGEGALFNGRKTPAYVTISDGTSNTLLFAESDAEIPWTKPDDLPFLNGTTPPRLGFKNKPGFWIALCDGRVIYLDKQPPEDDVRKLIVPDDGMQIPFLKIYDVAPPPSRR